VIALLTALAPIVLLLLKAIITGELDRKAADEAVAKFNATAKDVFDKAEVAARERARQNQKKASDLQDQLEQDAKSRGAPPK
jgi:hypothetical protein